jgi:DNA polymerase III subunit gamma/tau
MTLLRLLAFEPATASVEAKAAGAACTARSSMTPATAVKTRSDVDGNINAIREATAPAERQSHAASAARPAPSSMRGGTEASSNAQSTPPSAEPLLPLPETAAEWPAFVARLRLSGMAAQLGAQSELGSVRGNALTLAIPASHKHLADKAYADKLKAALEATTGRKLLLAFEIGDSSDASLAAIERRERARAKAEGEIAFRNEPFVRDLVAKFDATVRPETIEPVTRDAATSPSTRQEPP